VNLGREDTLDRAGLARLVDSINRYLGTGDPLAGVDRGEGDLLTLTESGSVAITVG
jgi:hypothetical protein